jgi:hypothetical protein
MSNVIDFLLSTEVEEIERPTKDVEIPRLSKLMNKNKKEDEVLEKFILTCKSLNYDKYAEIQDKCLEIKSKNLSYDVQENQIQLCINGVFAKDGKRFFYNKDLQEKFKAFSPKELCKKLLLSGEISKVADVITGLTGYEDDAIEEIKGL